MTIAKKKFVIGMAAVAMMSLVAAAPVSAVEGDTFGLNPISNIELGDQDLRTTIAEIINVALGLLGVIAVVIILAGGFKWMTAGGNDEKVSEARKLIFSGIIGLAIILSAWAITTFVIGALSDATGSGDVPTDF